MLPAPSAISTEVYSTDQGDNLFPLHNTFKATPRKLHSILGLQCRKKMDKLEGVQGNPPKAVGLEHLPQEERLGEL